MARGAGSGLSARLAWYAHRLRAMSLPELGHRIVEQAQRQRFRLAPPRSRMSAGRGSVVLPPIAAAFDRMAWSAPLVARWSVLADDIAAGRFRWFGVDWPEDGAPSPDWHRDPQTGRSWPADRFAFDTPFRHGETGDIKLVWELARLQYLMPLAALARVARRADSARLVQDHLAGWWWDNRPYFGIHWTSGIELALRSVSMLVALALLGGPMPDWLARCLEAHAQWLEAFPSLYSSANNHRTAEALGLVWIGCALPGHPRAAHWRAIGRAALEQAARDQIHPDGVPAEQSPTYGAFTLECLALGDWALTVWAADCGLTEPGLSAASRERAHLAARFLKTISDGLAEVPPIGDDDESRVILSLPGREAQVPRCLALVAGWLGRPELLPMDAQADDLRALFYPPPSHRPPAVPQSPPLAPPQGLAEFPAGGYTVIRDRIGGRLATLLFDHGPLGFASIAAHGHADSLALWLALDGEPVLWDAGTYSYHASAADRDWMRLATAHSVLSLAGQPSSLPAGKFNWRLKAQARRTALDPNPAAWSVTGEHDGYRSRFGLIHRRQIARSSNQMSDGGAITVTDRLIGWDGHAIRGEIGFFLPPRIMVEVQGQSQAILSCAGYPVLAVQGPVGLSAAIDAAAWASPRFGERQPTQRLVFTGEMQANRDMVTTLTPLAKTG